jgi:transposase
MRSDIYEEVSLFKMDGIKPNYSEISRRFDCDPRTVKRYYQGGKKERMKQTNPNKLEDYKDFFESKLDLGVSAMAIYK